jgi:hypothetical protein
MTGKTMGFLAGLFLAGLGTVQAQYTTSTNADNTLTIIGYTGPGGNVVIPTNINGLTVASIGSFAFFDSTNLTSVTIPGGIPNIGEWAFADCYNLTGAIIANGVITVGDDAFLNCFSLANVKIPASVTNVGVGLFVSCLNLAVITVPPLNLFYSSVNGVLFNKSQTTLIQYPDGLGGSYTIPGSVTNIGNDAFAGALLLTNVTIPSGVTSIGESAFEESGLTSLAIPSGVISVGNYAFYDCQVLTNLTIPGGVANIGNDAFAYTSLTNVTIPGGVTNIGTSAFIDCPNLVNVTISGSVTNIGTAAFYVCANLSNVFFLGNAPTVGSSLFYSDNNATVYYLPNTTGWSSNFAGIPAVLWNPLIQASGPKFGVRSNQFGFNVTGPTNLPVVVEACTNPASPVWIPLQTFTLSNGVSYFSEPLQTNQPIRYYGLGLP